MKLPCISIILADLSKKLRQIFTDCKTSLLATS